MEKKIKNTAQPLPGDLKVLNNVDTRGPDDHGWTSESRDFTERISAVGRDSYSPHT